MSAQQARLLDLIDKIQALLGELREAVQQEPQAAPADLEAVEAFADETFRDRDA